MASAMYLRVRVEEEEEFALSRSGATLSRTIRNMLDGGAADVITLPNIGRRTFPMIIAYLETHADVFLSDEERRNFDSEFASGMDVEFVRKLMIDAYYLKIEGLKRVLAPKMADMLMVLSATWKYKELRDKYQTPGWKESSVRTMLEMDWALVDRQLRRKFELEKLAEQAKKMQIQ